MFKARVFDSSDYLTRGLDDLLAAEFARTLSTPFGVMLAGGNTPLAAYRSLTRKPGSASGNAFALFSDDRAVPPDSDRSNYGNARAMLEALGIPAERVIRVHGEESAEHAAARYARDLASFFDKGGRITLGLLGLGADGHTASLFTLDHLERAAGKMAIAVDRPDGLQGVSVTPAVLERVERVVFAIAGADKRDMARQLLLRPDEIVAGRAVSSCPAVEVWFDKLAWPLAP